MKIGNKLLGVFFVILLWYGLTALHMGPVFLPPPHQVIRALFSGLVSGEFPVSLGLTLFRLMMAFTAATVTGVTLGVVIGMNRKLYDYSSLLLDFFRSLPVTALIPLFIFSFGVTDLSRVLVVYVAGVLVIIANTLFGTKNLEPLRIYSAKLSGMSSRRLLFRVILPEILPHVFSGMRTALSICLVISIVVEMLMGSNGLGTKIYNSQLNYNSEKMYAAIMLAGLTGLLLNKGFGFLENRILHWRQEWRSES